jgi:hypothetical protein
LTASTAAVSGVHGGSREAPLIATERSVATKASLSGIPNDTFGALSVSGSRGTSSIEARGSSSPA